MKVEFRFNKQSKVNRSRFEWYIVKKSIVQSVNKKYYGNKIELY